MFTLVSDPAYDKTYGTRRYLTALTASYDHRHRYEMLADCEQWSHIGTLVHESQICVSIAIDNGGHIEEPFPSLRIYTLQWFPRLRVRISDPSEWQVGCMIVVARDTKSTGNQSPAASSLLRRRPYEESLPSADESSPSP